MEIFVDFYRSPLGNIWVASDATGIVGLQMPGAGGKEGFKKKLRHQYRLEAIRFKQGGTITGRLILDLEAYFSGARNMFRVPVHPKGTPFQKRVWTQVSKIRYGTTQSYGDIARGIGVPKGARAIGQANRNNPLALIIPCHRVIAGNGELGGYSPGIEQKRWLLQWEKKNQSARS